MPPAPLTALLDAFAAEDGPATGRFAPDAVYAHGGPADDLRWSLTIARGPQEIAGALPHGSLELVAWVGGETACFAEARDDATTALLRVQAAGDGTIVRALDLRCAAVDPPPIAPRTPAPDARPVLEGYLEHLREGRFADAAACFTADCAYSHPPFPGGTERVRYRGRAAAHHGFVHDRGRTPAVQVITAFAQDGPVGFVEGVVDGIPDGGTFASTFIVDPDGLLARYVAFYGGPRVPPAG